MRACMRVACEWDGMSARVEVRVGAQLVAGAPAAAAARTPAWCGWGLVQKTTTLGTRRTGLECASVQENIDTARFSVTRPNSSG